MGVHEAQVVPTRSGPLRHRVGLALHGLAVTHRLDPVGRERERTLARPAGADLVEHGQLEGQLVRRERLPRPIRMVHDRDRFSPVALAAEKPVPETVVDLARAMARLLEPIDHAPLRRRDVEAVEEGGTQVGPIADMRRLVEVSPLDDAHDG